MSKNQIATVVNKNIGCFFNELVPYIANAKGLRITVGVILNNGDIVEQTARFFKIGSVHIKHLKMIPKK